MSLTILSYMHVLCRRADLVKKKKNTFLGIIILIFLACALRNGTVITGCYLTLKYQAKPTILAKRFCSTHRLLRVYYRKKFH